MQNSLQHPVKGSVHRVTAMFSLWLLCMFAIPFLTEVHADTSYGLEQKVSEINLLNNQLTSQKLNAILLREKLYGEKTALIEEIMGERSRKRIKSFKSAQANSRIKYNLLLIREVLGYISIINEKIRDYQIGNDKLAYLLQQAEDEIKIARTVNEMKMEALNSQIELVMEQYMTEAHTIVLNPDDISYMSTELIWKQLIAGKL